MYVCVSFKQHTPHQNTPVVPETPSGDRCPLHPTAHHHNDRVNTEGQVYCGGIPAQHETTVRLRACGVCLGECGARGVVCWVCGTPVCVGCALSVVMGVCRECAGSGSVLRILGGREHWSTVQITVNNMGKNGTPTCPTTTHHHHKTLPPT